MSNESYLHFYLGCRVETDLGNGTLEIVSTGDMGCAGSYSVLQEADGELYHETDLEWVKPILRKLDSMTEEEKVELDKMFLSKGYAKRTIILEAERTLWLLSKHFDLFGLIDAGLAIDAATVSQPAKTNLP